MLARLWLETRRVRHHLRRNPGQRLDERRYAAARIDQRASARDLAVLHQHDADFGDAVVDGIGTGGFEVDEGEALGGHGLFSG